MGTIAATLASIAAAAYSDTLSGLPTGFTPLAAPGLTNGTYANQNAFGAAVTGTLGGQSVVFLAFRGTDDRQDWINDFRNINTDYAKLATLVADVDSYAAQSHSTVVVTGHSLGGALTQVYMANHPAGGAVSDVAATFGSPGALITPASDARITNYEIADDPVPYLGLFRAEIGQKAMMDPVYAATVSVGLSLAVGDGVTPQDIAASIPFLTADYVNRGPTDYLPGLNGSQTTFTPAQFTDAASLGLTIATYGSEHSVLNYIGRSGSASVPDPVIQSPTPAADPVYRFFDTRTGSHFYTTDLGEKQQIQQTLPSYTYEGAPWAAPVKSAATHDVFRFFDTRTGDHFYTDNVGERDTVLGTLPSYKYEGVAFEAYNSAAAAGSAGLTLERFFNTQSGEHHFAANATEAAGINQGAAGPGWIDEGKAFTVHVPLDGFWLG